MAGTPKRLAGPAYFAAAVADVLAAPAAGLFNTIRHVHVANVTGGPLTFRLFLGATGGSAGGTELFRDKNVPANDAFDYWCATPQKSTDYLSGLASAANGLVITIDGEQSVVP
jgi:hypothetical protein